MNLQKVSQAVEAICHTGCTSVNAIIETLESGNKVDAIEDFTDSEIIALTKELKAIMSVYEKKN